MSPKDILKKFRGEGREITGSEFMEVWSHYDKDKSGKLEYAELNEFMKDLLLKKTDVLTETDILAYTEHVIELIDRFDVNKDGVLELHEMELLLHVKSNHLSKTGLNVDSILSSYDKHHKGHIKGSQLKELCADLMRRNKSFSRGVNSVDEFVEEVLRTCDTNKDNQLDREELKLFLNLSLDRKTEGK